MRITCSDYSKVFNFQLVFVALDEGLEVKQNHKKFPSLSLHFCEHKSCNSFIFLGNIKHVFSAENFLAMVFYCCITFNVIERDKILKGYFHISFLYRTLSKLDGTVDRADGAFLPTHIESKS